MNSIETIKIKNHTVEIFLDEFAESPREWDNLGTIVCWHKRYDLGDEHNYKTWQQWLVGLAETILEYDDTVVGWHTHELWEYAAYNNIPNPDAEGNYPLNAINDLLNKHFIILPIFAYEHGGITLNTSGFYCPWDSGQVGYIYVSKDKVKSEYGWKYLTKERIEKIESYLKSEVEIYNYYVMGRVYGYTSTCDLCGEEDSCWGFYGENWKDNGLLEYVDGYCRCIERQYVESMAIKE